VRKQIFSVYIQPLAERVHADMIQYALYSGWQTIFNNFSVYICTLNTFLKSASRDVQNAKLWKNAKLEYLIFVLPYLEGLV
jgi:hypothetical protein